MQINVRAWARDQRADRSCRFVRRRGQESSVRPSLRAIGPSEHPRNRSGDCRASIRRCFCRERVRRIIHPIVFFFFFFSSSFEVIYNRLDQYIYLCLLLTLDVFFDLPLFLRYCSFCWCKLWLDSLVVMVIVYCRKLENVK